jgi:hypothetical protein
MTVKIYVSSILYKGSLFFTSLPTFFSFSDNHFNLGEMVFHCSFDLHFPGDSDLVATYMSSFDKCLFRSLAPFKLAYLFSFYIGIAILKQRLMVATLLKMEIICDIASVGV